LKSLPLLQRRLYPEIGRAWEHALSEAENSLNVELLELGTVAIDLDKRHFLSKPVALAFIRTEINRLLVDERVIEAVEFLLDGLCPVLGARHLVSH